VRVNLWKPTLRTLLIAGPLLFFSPASFAADCPKQGGYVNDFIQALPEGMVINLETSLKANREAHHIEIILVIADISQSIEDSCGPRGGKYAEKLFTAWNAGAGKDNQRGVVFVVFSDGGQFDVCESDSLKKDYNQNALEARLQSAISQSRQDGQGKTIHSAVTFGLSELMNIYRFPKLEPPPKPPTAETW
jgi:hypothetical protein